jgi:RND family efflux transporter MFP subunit
MSRYLNSRTLPWASATVLLVVVTGSVAVLLARGSSPSDRPEKETRKDGQSRAILVRVVRPEVKRLKRITVQAAHLEAYEKVDVYAKASGYVEKFARLRGAGGREHNLDIGDRVTKDQVLAELWAPEMEQDLRQKEALVEEAQAELGQAIAADTSATAMVTAAAAKVKQASSERAKCQAEVDFQKGEHERYQRLLAERTTQQELVAARLNQYRAAQAALAGAQAAIDTAQANVEVEQARQAKALADVSSARAHVKVAKANLEQSKILLGYTQVRAPFAGVITRRLVDTGAFVQSAAMGKPVPLFTLARVDRLRILTDIPEADSTWVKFGQAATLRVDAARGHQFSGKVVRFADTLDPATRTMRVEVELDGREKLPGTLRPGLYGTLTITLEDISAALVLPASALVPSGEKPTVMVIENGVARRREVELGINDGITMQVTKNLTKDDRVLTDGKDAVRDGQPVEVVK